MMNKKAIAAFAAGATLLAGFAMATPAFAEGPANPPQKVLTKSEAKQVAEEKKQAYFALKNAPVAEAGKETPAPATTVIAADALAKCFKKEANGKFTPVEVEINKLTMQVGPVVTKYITDHNNWVEAGANRKAYEGKLQAALDAWTAAEAAVETAAADPVEKSDDEKKDAAIARVRTAAADLQTKIEKKQKTYAEYLKKKSAYNEAKEKVSACKEAVKAAQDALDNYLMSGDKDSKREERLNKVLKRANSELTAAKTKQSKAKKEFDEANDKATAAKNAWSKAVDEYDAAFEDAKSLGIDPTTLPVVSTAADPLDNDFLDLPGVGTVDPSAKPGKNAAQQGQAGKAGANGSAAAGAKTEVENKNGKDKRGNTHTGTGVGVTLTALAATMLAGMGAAVRKARH